MGRLFYFDQRFATAHYELGSANSCDRELLAKLCRLARQSKQHRVTDVGRHVCGHVCIDMCVDNCVDNCVDMCVCVDVRSGCM